jgi:hypothetical protein
MKTWVWLAVAAIGFGIMSAAYTTREKPDPQARWTDGCVAIGPQPADAKALPGQTTAVRLRFLPGIEVTEQILDFIEHREGKDKSFHLQAQLRPMLIELPFKETGISEASLQSGRLPAAGTDQVLAGAEAEQTHRLAAGDQSLEVVGRLAPELTLFARSYLIPRSDRTNALLPAGDPAVHTATLIELPLDQGGKRRSLEQLTAALPSPQYVRVMAQNRLDETSYYRYLLGLAIFLLGGSGAIIGFYRWAAERSQRTAKYGDEWPFDRGDELAPAEPTQPRWWAAPLLELQRRPGLVWGVHFAYFGLAILAAVLIRELPDLQTLFLSAVGDALSAQQGPLAAAGKAYASGNIPRAAAVTFAVNFFLGSLLSITVPSIIVPGSGVLIAAARCTMWGLILAPTLLPLAVAMLPHSGTMLLEGEAYILATIFGLLVPIYLAQSSLGGTALYRFGRAIRLNIQACAWVALVLAVAACYEATEVILMSR